MKSTLEGVNSRLNDTEQWSLSWRKVVEITNTGAEEKEDKINAKCTTLTHRNPRRKREREKKSENIIEDIMIKKCPNAAKETDQSRKHREFQ